MSKKQKIIVVLGPTASGKSDLAVKIALENNGEIISADSRQVYKGLDIGSGKITKKEMSGIKHYLLDVVSPKKVFSVFDYKEKSEDAIQKIVSKNKIPIVCGGTGFYIDTLVSGVSLPQVPENKKLREKLEKKSLEELQKIIKKIDFERSKTIDLKNKVRLIRAMEIAKELGKVPKIIKNEKYNVLYIGIKWEKEELKKRIFKRLISRLKQGMIKEVEKLHEKGLSWKRMNDLGLEYRYLSFYLQGKISKQEIIEKLNTEIWHYAKRQMTWFKRNKNIMWFKPNEIDKVSNLVEKFLRKTTK